MGSADRVTPALKIDLKRFQNRCRPNPFANVVRIPADGSSWIEAETTLDDGPTCNSVAIVPKLSDFMLERATMTNMTGWSSPLLMASLSGGRQQANGLTQL